MASHRPSWLLNPPMSFPCSSACTTHSRARPKPIVCYRMSRVGSVLVEYSLGRFPTQSSCLRGWIRYLQTHRRSPLGTRYTQSSLSHVNHVLSLATGIHSSSKMQWRMCRSMSFTGIISFSAFICPSSTSQPHTDLFID
jgi:hypothetical protein